MHDDLTDIHDRARQDLHASIVYFGLMNKLFYSDTERCMERCIEQNRAMERGDADFNEFMFWHRSLIRTFFAYIEGTTFLMRQIVIWAHERSELDLSQSELMRLREEVWLETGVDSQAIPKFNGFIENVTLAFKYFPKLFGSTFKLQKYGQGWNFFRRVLEARNSMAHPKTIDDYLVPAETLAKIRDSIIWFHESISNMIRSCT